MEPAPATRSMSRLQCVREALFQCSLCVGCFFYLLNPPHWAFVPRWLFTLLALPAVYFGLQRALHWLLISRYMGQTVTFRIGPRSRPLWQRTVTYDIPQVSAGTHLNFSDSTIVALGLTLATAIVLLFTVVALTPTPKANVGLGLLYFVADIALFVYTIRTWKYVMQQKSRRTPSRTQNTLP